MRASSCCLDAFDGRATASARFAFSAVDLVPKLKPTLLAGGCAIVADGAAAALDRRLECAAHDLVQPFDVLVGKIAGDGHWMDAGPMQRFIDVDVPQSADSGLIQQQRFDLAISAQQLPELSQRDLERVGTERSQAA